MTIGTSGDNSAGLGILVVGAGIAGLGAARALRQRGFMPDVVEQESTWTHPGAGIYLPATAWHSPNASPPSATPRRQWRHSKLGAAHAPSGSWPRRAAEIAPEACHQPSAIWCCADGDGTFSTPTTAHYSSSPNASVMRP